MNAMLVYEESECARKASALLGRATFRADGATRWNVKPWRLDWMIVPLLAEEALSDAIEAHLIMLAVQEPANVPFWLVTWLEEWARRRQVEDAALAVFEGSGGDMPPTGVTARLAAFAQRHGLTFILGDVVPAGTKLSWRWEDLRERGLAWRETTPHVLEPALAGSYQPRGINE